jgi:hypothetical protein
MWFASGVPAMITVWHTPRPGEHPIDNRVVAFALLGLGPLGDLVCLSELVNIHKDRRSLYRAEIRRARRLRVQLWRQYYKAGQEEREALKERFEKLDDSITALRTLPQRPEVPRDLGDVDLDLNEFHEKIELHRRAIVEAAQEMRTLNAA